MRSATPEPPAQDPDPLGSVLREIADLESRVGELREAASVPATDFKATLDAALIELDLAVTSLRLLGGGRAAGDAAGASDEERRILRTLFQAAPVPLFLLDRDGDVRRVNAQAAQLLGTSSGYAAGRPFAVFCDLKTRAALRSRLAAVVRTGERAEVDVRFLSGKRSIDASVTLVSAGGKDGVDPLIVAAAMPVDGRLPVSGHSEESDTAVGAVLHRMDVLAMAAELLLDEPLFNEAVAVRRCARLLAGELADWAIVDVHDGAELRRQVVFGPDVLASTAHQVEGLAPGPLASEVHRSRQSALQPHVEDLDVLGRTAEGVSVCGLLSATSVLCVPIEDGRTSLGVITLVSGAESGYFDLTDLGVVQRVARHLALVIRASRRYRRSAEVAQALQSSLLPRGSPVPDARSGTPTAPPRPRS
ncbi:PAS domain-containing protein, partial [Actinocorallia lasiicapitis]